MIILEESIKYYFATLIADEAKMKKIRYYFHKNGYFCFKNFSFLPKEILDFIHSEVNLLLQQYHIPHKQAYEMAISTEGTCSPVNRIGQNEIIAKSEVISLLYNSKSMKDFLANIARDTLVPTTDSEKFFIKKFSVNEGEEWHWKNEPYSLVFIIQAPEDISIGGLLECIPHTEWDKNNPYIWEYVLSGSRKSYHHLKGDVYFLKSDTTLTTLTPFKKNATKVILHTSWIRS